MADTSQYIPGIHFFCDHRCWRCPMTHRCRVWTRVADGPGSRAPDGGSPVARVAAVTMAAMHVTVDEVSEIVEAMAERGLMTTDDLDEAVESSPQSPGLVRVNAERDGLVMRGKEYAQGAMRVLQALRPRVADADDREAVDAIDRLEETCLTIASKLHRATCNWSPDEESRGIPQDDAHGSAKVALLLIEESRRSWRVLGAPGRSLGNGAPARFVAVLEALEAGVLDRFPRAMLFVRPGFDTEGRDPEAMLLARALNAPAPQGTV